jgi:hypothetical protein
MSGKGDKRRPGTGYADNWDRIFGKKEERKPSGGQIWMLKSAMETPYMEQAAAARALADAQESKLMTLSEAQKAGYSMEHDNCGPSASGAVIRVAKWDDALKCLQYIDVRPDADVAPSTKPTRITGNFRCKVNGLDTLNDAGFEVVTQPGFNYVLEAIEHPAKTCQHCKHWHGETKRCDNPEVSDMLDADGWRAFEPPADFGCLRWEGEV